MEKNHTTVDAINRMVEDAWIKNTHTHMERYYGNNPVEDSIERYDARIKMIIEVEMVIRTSNANADDDTNDAANEVLRLIDGRGYDVTLGDVTFESL